MQLSRSSYRSSLYDKIITLALFVAVAIVAYSTGKMVVGEASPEKFAGGLRATAIAATQPVAGVRQQRGDTVGQSRTFTLYSERGSASATVDATLEATGRHARIWVDNAHPLDQASISSLLERFDTSIYPRNLRYFASATGRMRAARVDVLITDTGQSDGYFDSGDITGQNGLNLIYLNASLVEGEPDEALNTLAHESTHLLFYLSGGADIEWLDEGMAVYSEYLNNSYPDVYVEDFRRRPTARLAGTFSNSNNYYGAAFLFTAFAAEQVERSNGSVPQFMRDLIANSNRGVTGVDSVLQRHISDDRFDSFEEIYRPKQLVRYAEEL